eukprot:gene20661-26788_t
MFKHLKHFNKYCKIHNKLTNILKFSTKEQVSYDVITVGAGPAGSEIGSHILSGNVFETKALDELFPNWKEENIPVNVKLVRWLGNKAEELGIDIYPGFAVSEVLYDDHDRVIGVATKDAGIGKDGNKKDNYTDGIELLAKQVIFAEGCRGSCSEEIINKYNLRSGKDIQSYGLGIKEVWQVPDHIHKKGFVQHTIGWPLQNSIFDDVYGGSFLYHGDNNTVMLGLVIGLDYSNPYINPYKEFQRWKKHLEISKHIEGGECIAYGARCINEGGYHAIPKLSFPGGLLVGCSAGFVNAVKIKGSHTAMKSGILAAEAIFETLSTTTSTEPIEITSKGNEPWTLPNHTPDSQRTKPAKQFKEIDYPKPDNIITFDLLTNLQRSGTYHDDQPSHLRIKDNLKHIPSEVSITTYAGPEQRFCPAGVYEYVDNENNNGKQLVINSQNCIHCKCCSIKTPNEYIQWTVPEGSGGPNYTIM